ncbi:NAD-dependent epimerase/dehydratase [Methanococcus vannielii SB]|uniref:NAD-dependent epimerase/dehydratase n=1 Tax=Methanococcus vannielii (strain ATCC 35089 / DSM 1224 / JCM 13029 / OCM 148 / SB) TaxID=406327 RepID=A6UP98_METVS|nr:NAD-dependent epimerase/dehydratase [Methanococcus vannielii SB]
MKILVTGAAGFIGFSFSENILKNTEIQIIGIDNLNPYYDVKLKEKRLDILKGFKNFKFFDEDIINYEELDEIFNLEKPDLIVHLAAQAGVRYSLENPHVYEYSNNLGTLNIFELAKKYGIKRVIFASSSSVYGGNEKTPFLESDNVDKPVSLYAATKKYNELIAHVYNHLYGIEMIGLRFFTVYGEFGRPDMAYWKFTKNILEEKPIDVYNYGKMKRDFTYISDIVEGIKSAVFLSKKIDYEIFNLGGDNPIELEYMISLIEKETGKKAIKNYLPVQEGDVLITMADLTKSKENLKYYPNICIEEGIKRFVKWYIQNRY